MAPHDDYQLRALNCLQQMERAKSEADRRAWKMLAGSFLLLRRFQQSAELENVPSKPKPWRCKTRWHGPSKRAVSFITCAQSPVPSLPLPAIPFRIGSVRVSVLVFALVPICRIGPCRGNVLRKSRSPAEPRGRIFGSLLSQSWSGDSDN